jgi:DNA polymerase elongation subunit (family B)
MAKKIQLNSAYGALGNKYFRWYDINHAEAITMSGQLSIRWIANALNVYLNKICKTKDMDFVIASDTDSVYLCLDKLVTLILPNETDTLKIVNFLDKVVKEKIEPFVDKSYQELADHMYAYQQKMVMKRECIADKAIWTAKKRYILNVWNQEGVLYTSAKLKMSGIEAVKSSTPLACRNSIKDAIGVILKGSELDLQTYVSKFRETFKILSFQEIASPRGVSNITQYVSRGAEMFVKGTPIHVKGSILYNNLLDRFKLDGRYEKVSNGEKIKFCYLKSPNPYRVNVISCIGPLPSEFGLDNYIDYDIQFEKAFIDPLKIIVTAIGWEVEKTSNLESFFS